MFSKSIAHASSAIAVVMLYVVPAMATDIIKGHVMDVGNEKITIQSVEGRTSTVPVNPDAKITRDGRLVKLDDVRTTDIATVTLDNHMKATVIEAKSGKLTVILTSAKLAADQHQGTCVSAGTGRITLLDQNGKDQVSFPVADNVKVTRDGKAIALEELKPGDGLVLTTERRLLREVVTEISATTSG